MIYFIRRHSGRNRDVWRTILVRGDAIAAYGRYLRLAADLREGSVQWWLNGELNQGVYSGRNRTRW
jgi:hypothetical protein